MENSLILLQMVKQMLPYDPVILLLGIFPRKIYVRIKTGTQIFIVALFVIANINKKEN